ncbi:hypothetical protein CC78DRAFT_97773 [Lojkania enalia]|uniref:Uncharacterized protein n=1 Tax=Lojkania enalia TaxID=147567 RepID=A0A9P4JXH5_9PLEO|nr:hypothetical protein CC78DRAFT_97773 [Didymosphaeria enalia]
MISFIKSLWSRDQTASRTDPRQPYTYQYASTQAETSGIDDRASSPGFSFSSIYESSSHNTGHATSSSSGTGLSDSSSATSTDSPIFINPFRTQQDTGKGKGKATPEEFLDQMIPEPSKSSQVSESSKSAIPSADDLKPLTKATDPPKGWTRGIITNSDPRWRKYTPVDVPTSRVPTPENPHTPNHHTAVPGASVLKKRHSAPSLRRGVGEKGRHRSKGVSIDVLDSVN